jgi:hypothetical protein
MFIDGGVSWLDYCMLALTVLMTPQRQPFPS